MLGLLGETSAPDSILRPMRKLDADPLVRQQALEAMWRLGDEEALKPLVALTASRYADDKIIGLLALAAPRRQLVREHVRGLLAGDDVHVEVTLVAARAMGMLGSDEGYKIAAGRRAAARTPSSGSSPPSPWARSAAPTPRTSCAACCPTPSPTSSSPPRPRSCS